MTYLSDPDMDAFVDSLLAYEEGSVDPETVLYNGVPITDPMAKEAFQEALREIEEGGGDF